MKVRQLQKMVALVVMIALSVTPALAQSTDKKLDDKKLDDKNNPLLIGKRDINKGQLAFYSLDKEVALGRQLAAEVDRSSKVVADPLITEYVNRVGQNIVLHSDAKVPFTIKVIDSNDVNAFALPGGFLYVNRGLIEAADNEAEVAGVLAHEIAHVTARHGIEQASKGQLLNYASIPLIFFGGIGGYIVQQVAAIAVPLTFLKFSRGAEKEADRLGAQYMWASGYDPNALVTFFEKLQSKDKKKPGTIAKVFSSHPLTGDRIKEVNDLVRLFPDRAEYQVSSSEFNDVKSRVVAASAASRSVGSGNDRRPTLKRRGGTTTDDPADDSADSNRPVLKRRDSTSGDDPATAEPSSDAPQRPVLKRRDGSSEQTPSPSQQSETPEDKPAAKPADKTSDTPGRPTLKRRGDS
jgi:beta-barrel assembly-enhancing protease